MAKAKEIIDDELPTGGGSFIRNPDGSLSKNEADPQTATAPDVAEENLKE
jgi:hypothetical protein